MPPAKPTSTYSDHTLAITYLPPSETGEDAVKAAADELYRAVFVQACEHLEEAPTPRRLRLRTQGMTGAIRRAYTRLPITATPADKYEKAANKLLPEFIDRVEQLLERAINTANKVQNTSRDESGDRQTLLFVHELQQALFAITRVQRRIAAVEDAVSSFKNGQSALEHVRDAYADAYTTSETLRQQLAHVRIVGDAIDCFTVTEAQNAIKLVETDSSGLTAGVDDGGATPNRPSIQ